MSHELYWLPGSCARVAFVALEEAGAAFELKVMNRWKGDTERPEFRALNPKGKVPVLKIDDWVLTENAVIVPVLAEEFPRARILPSGDRRAEVRARELLTWFGGAMHAAVGRHRFPGFFTVANDEAAVEGVRLKARADLEEGFAIAERILEGRDWLLGEWSALDPNLLYLFWRAVCSGMDPAPFPRCAAHARRTEAWPSVAKVLDREEAEFARAESEGTVPADLPPYHAGRIPDGMLPA